MLNLFSFYKVYREEACRFVDDILHKEGSGVEIALNIKLDSETSLLDVIKERKRYPLRYAPNYKEAWKLYGYLNGIN